MRGVLTRFMLSVFIISTLLFVAGRAFGADYGKISASELKARLGDPNLLIIDVRDPISWSAGKTKISGALREDPENVGSWAKKYPTTKELVVY